MGRLKILKGASPSLPASRDGDTLYFCSDGKLYNGDSLIAEKNPTVDSALSSTSTNAVQNKVVNTALAGKAAASHTHTKSQVGLGNVDNTADSAKNVLSATKLTTARTIGISGGASGTATSFNGTAAISIPVTSVKEAYLDWGGKNLSGLISPVDAAMSSSHSANRLQFCNPAGVTVEYSTDGGTTWVDYGLSDSNKIALLSDIGSRAHIGKKTSATASNPATVNDKLRITLNATNMGVYTSIRKMLINISSNGASGCNVTVEYSKKGSETTWYTLYSNVPISGWSGWNSIAFSGYFGGNATKTSNWANIRLTFGITGVSSSYSSALEVRNILLFGDMYWNYPSSMAKSGHLYSYDTEQNAYFPAAIKEGNTWLSDKYAAKTHTHTSSQVTGLSSVATSGSYSDLSNKPTIPTVNNATVTIKQAGTQKGSFTLNQSGATTIELTDNNTTYSAATTSAAGLMSAADKTKLDGIATGAQVNTITGVKGNAESSYRTGNVNLTPANIGAAAATHTHSYLPLSGGNVTGNVDVTGDVNAGKLIGDVMSGDIVPAASEAFSIGSSAAKYNGVYASNFYGNATSADSATKATQDGSGNNIVNTYLTKTSASSTYSPKAGSSSLTTCAKGTFGDAAVKSVTTAVTSGSSALVTSGGVYNAVQSVKNSIPSVMGMATYKAVSLSSGKLVLQCLSYQGEQYLQSFSQGAVIKVIDPSGVCQGSIDRLEDGSQDTMVVNGGLSYPNSGFEGVVYYNETTELNELYITGYN